MDLIKFLLTFSSISAVIVNFADGKRLRQIFPRYRDRYSEVATATDNGKDGARSHVTEEDAAIGTAGLSALRSATVPMRRTGHFEAYRSEIESKLQQVDTPEDYLEIFYPHDDVDMIWLRIVNSSYNHRIHTDRVRHGDQQIRVNENTSTQIREDLTNHMQQMSCSQAKPVTIDMYDELNITRNRPVYIVPECTTVLRCQNSGCCSRVKPCIPRDGTRETVTKTFLVTELTVLSHNDVLESSPSVRLLNYTFEEDTICDCLGAPSLPTCDISCDEDDNKRLNQRECRCECIKKCPYPYIQDDDCSCDCEDDDLNCKKTKRGKKNISYKDCSCIISGKCYSPPCKKGYVFSEHSCRCEVKNRQNGNRNNHGTSGGRTSINRGRGDGDEPMDLVISKCATQTEIEESEVSDFDSAISLSGLEVRDSDLNLRTDNSCEDENVARLMEDSDSDEDTNEASGRIP